jgi:hypothetical protein
MQEVSLISRFAGAGAAIALFSASLTGAASAAPLAGLGLDSFDSGLQQVQMQNKPVHGGKPAPGGPGHGKPGHAVPGGPAHGNWAHGGGGHWQNGAWIPFAVGFGLLGAAAAAAAYGAPPQPGMCWYYDDPFHTTGHWDYC